MRMYTDGAICISIYIYIHIICICIHVYYLYLVVHYSVPPPPFVSVTCRVWPLEPKWCRLLFSIVDLDLCVGVNIIRGMSQAGTLFRLSSLSPLVPNKHGGLVVRPWQDCKNPPPHTKSNNPKWQGNTGGEERIFKIHPQHAPDVVNRCKMVQDHPTSQS